MRKLKTAEEKLAVTLRCLATGRNIKDLRFSVTTSLSLCDSITPTSKTDGKCAQDQPVVSRTRTDENYLNICRSGSSVPWPKLMPK